MEIKAIADFQVSLPSNEIQMSCEIEPGHWENKWLQMPFPEPF